MTKKNKAKKEGENKGNKIRQKKNAKKKAKQ